MFTAFPFVAVFFSTNPVGRWLKSKAFMLLGIVLVLAAVVAAYAALVRKIERDEKTKLLVQQQAQALDILAKEVQWLKASAKSTEEVLTALEGRQNILDTQSKARAVGVTTKVTAIANSTDSAAIKAQRTSAVYATALQDAYCAAAPERCASPSMKNNQ